MQQYLRLEEIKLALVDDESLLETKILKILGCKKEDIISYNIVKKSIDSREKNNILFIYSVDIDLKQKNINLTKPNLLKHKAKYIEQFIYDIPVVPHDPLRKRPIVVGTGPAGLFA
jgi:uncharacterized FAD-dependent dehydrogenase